MQPIVIPAVVAAPDQKDLLMSKKAQKTPPSEADRHLASITTMLINGRHSGDCATLVDLSKVIATVLINDTLENLQSSKDPAKAATALLAERMLNEALVPVVKILLTNYAKADENK